LTSQADSEPDATAAASGAPIEREAKVPLELAGLRLDRIAAELFADYSRAELTRWIRAGELLVDGKKALAKRKLNGGEQLKLSGSPRVLPDWQAAQAVDFEVVYADAAVAVINKPAGLVVHPGAGQTDGTLVNGLLHRFAHEPGEDPRHLPRAGVVHRLDKDTSGLMVVGRTSQAVLALTEAIGAREVRREYLAVVEGVPTGGFDIDAPIGRDPYHRTRQAVVDDGKYALTHVRIVERFAAHALVSVRLETGRTHQIRVHLAHLGFPLVGDVRYGAKRRLPTQAGEALVSCLQQFSRQALHATRLGFVHPDQLAQEQPDNRDVEPMLFDASVPDDMQQLLALLRERGSDSR